MSTRRAARRVLPCVLPLLAWATAVQAGTLYVNADGTGDYPNIRAAVVAAQSEDVIVLEQGVYFGFNNQDIMFSGKALTLRSRDPNNPVIVSKTIIDCQGDREKWSTHWAIGATGNGDTHLTLAGLTLAEAYEVGSGGAVRCEEADLDVINCTFRNNATAMSGGAVYCRDNRARFVGCTFAGNSSVVEDGGALYSTGSQLDFVDCSFQASTGGAIKTYDCQITLTGCTFQNNKGREGGAVYSRADTRPEATSLTIANCTFTANTASGNGGALYVYGVQAAISACTFTANTTSLEGGALYNYRANPTILSCLFAGNTAVGDGGAVQNVISSPNLLNCTLVVNTGGRGGAVAAKGGSSPLISHSILWGNAAAQGASLYLGNYQWSQVSSAKATVEFCDVEGGRPSAFTESGCTLTWDTTSNLSRDPLFAGQDNGDYHLAPDSPCINAGDPAYTPQPGQTDRDGAARNLGSAVDLGAYEFQGLGPVYRFWSPSKGRHFYTISSADRDALERQAGADWQFEDAAFYAFYVPVTDNLRPVYRFWARQSDSHFYTINEEDRDWILREWPDVWTYECVAFYAYPEGQQPLGTLPVYRFWSGSLGSHFYTIREEEKDALLRESPSVWEFEGVAWYAYATPCPPGNATYEFTGGPQEATYTLTLSALIDGKNAQITTPDIRLSPSGTWMQMALNFNKQTTALDGLRVQTEVTASNATLKLTGTGVTIPLDLSLQASFEMGTSQGPYPVDPETRAFADFTRDPQTLAVSGPVFQYSGSAQIGDQRKSFDRSVAATQLELKAYGTFEALDQLPDGIQAQMPSTFQWRRQATKDVLAEASVNGHLVQVYVTGLDVSTQGLWKGKIVK